MSAYLIKIHLVVAANETLSTPCCCSMTRQLSYCTVLQQVQQLCLSGF